MGRTKKLLSLLLFIAMAASLFAPAVFASPCCEIFIQGAVENSESVEFNMSAYLYVAPRDIEVRVFMQDSEKVIASETVTVGSDHEDFTVSFSKSVFLEGCTYKIVPVFKELCPIGICYAETYTYTAEEGTPVLDIKEINGKPFDLVGGAKAIVGIKTDAAGFYDLSINDETGNIRAYDYSTNRDVWPGREYYEGGQTLYYVVESKGNIDSRITIGFDLVPVEGCDSLITGTPEHNDKCFAISGNSGMRKINITSKGVYLFKCSGSGHANFQMYNSDGYYVADLYDANDEVRKLLTPGSYYVNSDHSDSRISLDIYYNVPDEVKYNTSYSMEGYEDENYYTIKLERPAYISIDSDSGNVGGIIQSFSTDMSVHIPEYNEVLPAGSYCFNAYNYSGGKDTKDSYRLTKTEVDSAVLDVEAAPAYTNKLGNSFFAFMAPRDGEFEFDFSQSEGSNGKKFNLEDKYINDDFVYRKMKKNEWVSIRIYGNDPSAVLTVRAVGEPQFTELTLDTPQQIGSGSGKRLYYAFTPTETDVYKIRLDSLYCDIKVYTENSVLFDGSAQNMKLLDLKAGEPVSIVVIGGDEQNSIAIAKGVIKLENGKSFTLEQNTSTNLHFCPEKDGFYKLNIQKNGYSNYLEIYVNDKYASSLGTQDGANAQVSVYGHKGENVLLRFNPCGTGNDCTATVTATEIEAVPIYADQSISVSYDTNYIFAPESSGVYSFSDADNYGVWFSVASSLGGDPIYGNNGNDAVLGAIAGEKYLITFNSSYDLLISKLSSEKAELNTSYTTGTERAVFEMDVPEDGYYRIANDLSNTDMRILFDDEWSTVSGTYSNLFRLKKGTALIMATPTEYADGTQARADFTVEPSSSTAEMSISAEDLFYMPTKKACARFLITAPEGKEVSYGFEYTCEDGTTGVIDYKYESMLCSDKRYTEVPYIDKLNLGSTYTIRPFLYPSGSDNDKVYGEEKTFTLKEANIERLLYSSNPISIKVQDSYHYSDKEIFVEFVQPGNAPDKTYITVPDYIEYYSVYDSTFNYVSCKYEEGKAYYQLSPGKKYYIAAQAFGDGNAPINISSLPEKYSISDAAVNKEDGTVSFTLPEAAVKGTVIYVALYDGDGALLELWAANEPCGEQIAKLEGIKDAKKCKLLYMLNESLLPLCESTELPLSN